MEDREGTARFLLQVSVFDVFRERVEELLAANPEVMAEWKLRAGGSSEVVFANDLNRLVAAGTLSVCGVSEAVGNLSGPKFRELWSRVMVKLARNRFSLRFRNSRARYYRGAR